MQWLKVRDVALEKWPAILLGFGLTEQQLSGKHCPCPICGGHDRFRFDDKEGRGTWFCSHCGAGDGINLVMRYKGWDFKTAARKIERAAGVLQAGTIAKGPDETQKLEKLRDVWSKSKPLEDGDKAMCYLAGRGLSLAAIPYCLRLHPALPYFEGQQAVGKFPALVARVVEPDGSGATLHRTYIQDCKKAPVPSPKKLMPGKAISGCAVRLFQTDQHLGIAEGIETALAAAELFGLPVWSCISAHGIETFEPPTGVTQVTIFADHDASFTGQQAAFASARRLTKKGIQVEVRIPDDLGDWLDVLVADRKLAA